MSIVISFTGSRNGMSVSQTSILNSILVKATNRYTDIEAHHGDCVGADSIFHDLALVHKCTIIKHPGPEGPLRADCWGAWRVRPEKSYLERNRDLVDECDLLIAVPKESKEPKTKRAGGTWYTIRYARKINKPHAIIWPNGEKYISSTIGKFVSFFCLIMFSGSP